MLEGTRAAEGDFILGAFNRKDGATDSSQYGAPHGEMIGTVGLVRNQRLKQRHRASVVGMYVVPEAAGRGAVHCRTIS